MIICHLCKEPITKRQQIEYHHPVYKSQGGTETAPTHKACHRRHHSEQGDFAIWGAQGGKLSSEKKAWAFNLKHVNTHPAYAADRAFYLANYAK